MRERERVKEREKGEREREREKGERERKVRERVIERGQSRLTVLVEAVECSCAVSPSSP